MLIYPNEDVIYQALLKYKNNPTHITEISYNENIDIKYIKNESNLIY